MTGDERDRRDSRALEPELVAIRRRFHRIPEVGLALPATQEALVSEAERISAEREAK